MNRFAAWLLTGPVGRFAAFVGDLGAAWGRWVLRRMSGERSVEH